MVRGGRIRQGDEALAGSRCQRGDIGVAGIDEQGIHFQAANPAVDAYPLVVRIEVGIGFFIVHPQKLIQILGAIMISVTSHVGIRGADGRHLRIKCPFFKGIAEHVGRNKGRCSPGYGAGHQGPFRLPGQIQHRGFVDGKAIKNDRYLTGEIPKDQRAASQTDHCVLPII